MKKVNGYCHICKEPIYDSITPNRMVECGMCVQKRVKHIERIELESRMSINNRVEYGIARKIAENTPASPTRKRVLKRQKGCNELKTVKFLPNFQSTDRKKLPMKWEDQLL